jgi:hypothetical protein
MNWKYRTTPGPYCDRSDIRSDLLQEWLPVLVEQIGYSMVTGFIATEINNQFLTQRIYRLKPWVNSVNIFLKLGVRKVVCGIPL